MLLEVHWHMMTSLERTRSSLECLSGLLEDTVQGCANPPSTALYRLMMLTLRCFPPDITEAQIVLDLFDHLLDHSLAVF